MFEIIAFEMKYRINSIKNKFFEIRPNTLLLNVVFQSPNKT